MHRYQRWSILFSVCVCLAAGLSFATRSAESAPRFEDPLDFPARMRTAVTTRPLLGVTHAGSSLVAVGSRGMIVCSEDDGVSWTQSGAPVQSDLLAVQFPTEHNGWAVGHDGVILHSSDGGKNWTKQLDGRIAADLFKAYYAKGYAAQVCDPVIEAAKRLIDLNYKEGPSLPWLDVWFEDARTGFVVGSFGMIAATADGGRTWEPWLHRIDNAEWLNLNSIRGVGEDIYITGERGRVWKLDRKIGQFQAIDTGYVGSFFGIAHNTDILLVFGLRGVVYRRDNTSTTWEALKMPSGATVTAGVSLDSSGFVLVNSEGQMLLGDAQGRSFKVLPLGKPMRFTGVVVVKQDTAVVTGLGGVQVELLSDPAK